MTFYTIRAVRPEDNSFLISSYLKSQRYIHPNQEMRDIDYFREFKPIAESMVESTEILIACNPEDEWQIFGWISYYTQPVAVNYIYVKFPYRKNGLAKDLFNLINPHKLPMVATHTSPVFEQVKERYRLNYNPKHQGDTNGNNEDIEREI